MKNLCEEIGFRHEKYVLLCGSQSTICAGKNSIFHSKSKHIHRMYHWIRDVVASEELKLEKVHTDDNGTDMMTKTLTRRNLRCTERYLEWMFPPPSWRADLLGSF